MPFCWGIGFFGVEGFGLPGPIVPCSAFNLFASNLSKKVDIVITSWTFSFTMAFVVSAAIAVIEYGKSLNDELSESKPLPVARGDIKTLWVNVWLSWLFNWVPLPTEKVDFSVDFESIRTRIVRLNDNDQLPVELHRLRTFLILNNLTKHRSFRDYYSKWLTHMSVRSGVAASNVFSGSEVKLLKYELSRIEKSDASRHNWWR